jgi:hypothetical protein
MFDKENAKRTAVHDAQVTMCLINPIVLTLILRLPINKPLTLNLSLC